MTTHFNLRCVLVCLALLWSARLRAEEKVSFLRGAAARQAWEKSLQPTIQGLSLREALRGLCESRKLAWILDRRIDPDQAVSFTAGAAPLSSIVNSLLQPIQAQAILLGDTIVVGPSEPIQWLRTLADRQRIDLQASGLTAAEISELSRPVNWSWGEATEPRQLLAGEARRLSRTIEGLDQLPYDLWGSGSLAGMTPGEAITVIAWQYDLRLHWSQKGTASLVPIQLPIEVSRVLPNFSADQNAVTQEFPGLHLQPQGKAMEVRGRIEDLESLEKWLKGTAADRSKKKPMKGDWRSRKFTLNVENAPLIDLLKLLKQKGLPLEWDEATLTAAGVDLKQKVSLNLTDTNAVALIEKLCGLTGLKSEADGSRVVISP